MFIKLLDSVGRNVFIRADSVKAVYCDKTGIGCFVEYGEKSIEVQQPTSVVIEMIKDCCWWQTKEEYQKMWRAKNE